MSPEQRRLARVALLTLMVPRCVLLFTSVEQTRRLLDRLLARARLAPPHPADPARSARSTAAIVSGAAQYLWPRPSCLHRSLVLSSLLGVQGITSELRFGVRRRNDIFEAHAWVEYGGLPLTEPGDLHREYTPLRAVSEPGDGGKP